MTKNILVNITALLLLLSMFLLTVFSIRNDTFTFDETAHIPAGYSYLTQKDYRMNPEHPPLIKDLSAIPLLFLHLNFPKDSPTWTDATPAVWWHQFDFGTQFLYNSGNNPDKMLFWGRMPMILIMIFLGWFIFMWAKKLWGNKAALLALCLFSFSPTFLAHGRFITTDVGAAFGTVFATYFWLEFLRKTTKKSLIFAGLAFGIAMIIKFSLILLLPFFALITLAYAWLNGGNNKKIKNILRYIILSFLAGIIGVVFVIWPVYEYHIAKYPKERQIKDTKALLATTRVPQAMTNINVLLDKNFATRPLGQYVLGILTATNRVSTGNTTYFMGKISADSWKSYFPIVYFIKNPLPFHILTLTAILYAIWLILLRRDSGGQIKKPFLRKMQEWIKDHFTEFSMFVFLGIYWFTSIFSNLNIGVRHLMPVFPFTILLVSAMIVKLLKEPFLKLKCGVLGVLILWQAVSVISIYPHFLAYFNEAVGGPEKGYLYAVDSNLDWGQDLKRLAMWIDGQNKQCTFLAETTESCIIDKIYIDYFGGGNLDYYLGKNNYATWSHGKNNPSELPKGSYFAVSATQMQGGRAVPDKGFDQPSDYYRWLDKYNPIAKIGYSIFIYKIY